MNYTFLYLIYIFISVQATNPLNSANDPNVIQSVCQAVTSENGGMQTAVRLLVHKMQSPQEKEAMQALLVS